MPFAYYRRLKPFQKKIYRRSDAVKSVPLLRVETLMPWVDCLSQALSSGLRSGTEEASQGFVTCLTRVIGVPPVKVVVLEQRPSHNWGELHGLYERRPEWRYGKITVWMRTAKQERIVAFKTFLRTILHEVTHHLDYTLLRLPDSFHTEGFYQRESSLVKQLIQLETKIDFA